MSDPVILFDPHPRMIDQMFSLRDKARLEGLGTVIWHDGSPTPDAVIEKHLPNTMALIGQTPMTRERLDRAPNLRVIFNVESNFLPNVDYNECHHRGIYARMPAYPAQCFSSSSRLNCAA